MKKLFILSLLFFSQGVLADNLYKEAQNEIETEKLYKNNEIKIDKKDNNPRTVIRNEKTVYELENELLKEKIKYYEQQKQLKALEYENNTIPAEYLRTPEEFYKQRDKKEKEDIKRSLPSISDKIKPTYNVSTYQIDEMMLALLEDKKREEAKQKVKPKEPVINADDKNAIKIQKNTSFIKSKQTEDLHQVDIQNEGNEKLIRFCLTEMINDLDNCLAKLVGNNEVPTIKSPQIKSTKIKSKAKKPVNSATIDHISIKNVFIYGDKKTMELEITASVKKNGVSSQFKNTLKDVKEGQTLNIQDFLFTVESIAFKEVTIKSNTTNEVFVGSKEAHSF